MPRTMLPPKFGPSSTQYILWCEAFHKMRIDYVPAVLNTITGRGHATLFSIFVLCRGDSEPGENCGSAVDYLLWPCGTEVGKMPDVYAHVLKVYPF